MKNGLNIEAEIRDITRPLTEAVVCSGNCFGLMVRGSAKALKEIAGQEAENEAKLKSYRNGKLIEAGDCFSTRPYKMSRRGVKVIYHAVIKKYPGGITSLDFVTKSIRKVLEMAVSEGIKTIAIPGIGTGEGRLDKSSVASIMFRIVKDFNHKIEVRFVDTNKEFINEVEQLLSQR